MSYHRALAGAGDTAGDTAAQAGKLLDKIIKDFPRTNEYPREFLAETWHKVLSVSDIVFDAGIQEMGAVTSVFTWKEFANFTSALLNQKIKFAEAYGPLIRKARQTQAPKITAPKFKDDVIRILIQIKNSGEGIASLEDMKPWWLQVSGAILELLAEIARLIDKVKDVVKGTIDVVTIVLAVVLAATLMSRGKG